VAALVAAAAFAALAAGWTASAAPSASPAAPASLPLPTPTLAVSLPAITLPPLPTASLPLPTLPLPTLIPLPTQPGAPGVAPTPTAGSGGANSSPASATSPWIAGGAPPTSGSTGGDSLLGNTSSVLGSLLALLGTPASVGVEQPSLEHFGSQSQPATAAAAAHGSPLGRHGGPAGWVVVVCVVLMAGGAALLWRSRARRFYRAAAIAAVPAALVVGVLGVAAGTTTGAATPVAAIVASSAGTAGSSHATAVSRQLSGPGFELLGRVAGLETTIARQGADLHALTQQPAAVAGQTPGRGQSRVAQDLAGQQHQLATTLEGTLQQEYIVYASAAQDPTLASALLAAASTQPAPVRNAVDYNVQAVQAALAQEAAIARAAQSGANAPLTSGSLAAGPASTPILSPPLAGAITQGFGPTTLAFEPAMRVGGITYPHFHTGLDIAAPMDTPVQAAAAGVVALAGAETDGQGHLVGYGNYVVIAHGGGMITLYGHLDKILVKTGQAVHAGDPIGLEGSTGNSTGAHVHFEVRVDGVPVDPRAYLRPGSL
jgi:murein DD-endopeptidase MepM/ murein hydrolase activator NlpD